ncbi:flagellar protein FlaG [Alicyclobacillus tolerans]|uniref:flagellar protein FlaG n=1 Tax=Alicyclobacillus tolerans TaxID=90970 RepID=UPI001F44CF8B|nr:flagellar protein FlaG [Alicyclobacillus tolerans]MCF8568450.1 flagellar protein FlaG [Alicyclobacillus tolerans]
MNIQFGHRGIVSSPAIVGKAATSSTSNSTPQQATNEQGAPSSAGSNRIEAGGGTSNSHNGSAEGPSSSATLVEQLNKKLYPQGLQAVFQYDQKSHMTWLNVVNKATGQVVDRYPPEKIREMVDSTVASGVTFDKRL